MSRRPLPVMVIAGFLFFATAIALIVGVSLLFPNPLLDRLWEFNRPGAVLFRSIGRISGVFLLALAGGTLTAARGLLGGRRWAWWFATILFASDFSGNIVSYFLVHDALRALVGALISSAFFFMLMRQDVRLYCSR